MHEVGLIQDALTQAIDVAVHAGAPRIEGVNFVIFDGGHLTEEVVRDLFEALSTGTIADGAHVAVEVRPSRPLAPLGESQDVGVLVHSVRPPPELFLESILIPDESETAPCV